MQADWFYVVQWPGLMSDIRRMGYAEARAWSNVCPGSVVIRVVVVRIEN